MFFIWAVAGRRDVYKRQEYDNYRKRSTREADQKFNDGVSFAVNQILPILDTLEMAAQRLKEAAEKAKIELSSARSSQINLPFITADATGPKHLDMTLTRAKFNELTADLVDRTMTLSLIHISTAG